MAGQMSALKKYMPRSIPHVIAVKGICSSDQIVTKTKIKDQIVNFFFKTK